MVACFPSYKGGDRSLQQQQNSDPEIQEIVARLQQFNRDLEETKELFRSGNSSLDRRRVPRWKSDADLANRRWRNAPDPRDEFRQRPYSQERKAPFPRRAINGFQTLPMDVQERSFGPKRDGRWGYCCEWPAAFCAEWILAGSKWVWLWQSTWWRAQWLASEFHGRICWQWNGLFLWVWRRMETTGHRNAPVI